MAQTQSTSTQLRAMLAKLEQEVRVPVVPGDCEAWCRQVSENMDTVLAAYTAHLEGHRDQINQILEMHTELTPVAHQLQARERQLHADVKQLLARVGVLLTSESEAMQPQEIERLNRFRSEILSWILSSRTFDAEVETWLMEATLRDYGGTE